MTLTQQCPRDSDVDFAERLFDVVARVAAENDVRQAVEANHDQNRWWPTSIRDWRLRMLIAGWSTRISYAMIDTYTAVVADVADLGYDVMRSLPDSEVHHVVGPLGLATSRRRYLRSLDSFLTSFDGQPAELLEMDADAFIQLFADSVQQAGYKVAQCVALYSRGYHSGIIPVDSGMVTRLAPRLGLDPGRGQQAHDVMRMALEHCAQRDAGRYRMLITELGYAVDIPHDVAPTWWLHLVLIYFKRLYCNRPSPRLCHRLPMCGQVLDCGCS